MTDFNPHLRAGIAIRNYLRDWEKDLLTRRQLLLANLQRRKRVIFNSAGSQLEWQVPYRRAPAQALTPSQAITVSRQDRFVSAVLPWREYSVADGMYKMERLQNRGRAAIIKYYAQMGQRIADDLFVALCEELFIDGSASGNGQRWYGLKSMFGPKTQTIDITAASTTARTANAADPVFYSNKTYAKLSTELGDKGGSWNGVWPVGTGSYEYDYFTPLEVQKDSTYFGSTPSLVQAIRYGITHSLTRQKPGTHIEMVLMDSATFYEYQNTLDSKERILIPDRGKNTEVYLGQREGLFQDGAMITWEYGVPANEAFGINLECIELHSMQDSLVNVTDPEYDTKSRFWYVVADMYGQLKFESPKNFIHWSN